MFKYIADILSKLSLGQRLIALCILLLTIVIIYLGPKLITAVTYDDTELRTKITELKADNAELTTYVNNTNEIIRTNQKECTDQQLQREKDFLAQIIELENLIKHTNKTSMNNVVVKMESMDEGSMNKTMSYPVVIENIPDPIIKQVSKIKSGIQKEITEKKK